MSDLNGLAGGLPKDEISHARWSDDHFSEGNIYDLYIYPIF